MKASDLDLRELLDLDPKGGVMRFAGQRVLLMDAIALGLLRRELIATIGLTGAKGVLTRLGFAHGWRTAETLKTAFPWDSESDWKRAGGRLHTLQGLVRFEPIVREDAPFAESLWHDSYEAEQHLAALGLAEEPVCWTLTGFASGYLSYCNGTQIYCVEDRCVGKGDAVCRMSGKRKEEWGEKAAELERLYASSTVEGCLEKVTETLKKTERKLRSRQRELRDVGGEGDDASGIVSRSEGMKKVLELARRVAKVDSTVLVTGESGVGKERLATFIHDGSPRASGAFVAINCGALPETLLESELFGHAKGAFTGADHDRAGLFEAANGGTLFLDEIGEITPAMQVKLLRVLQEREVRRVGENKNRPVNVRVIAATNRDLAAEVIEKRFRQDLYYRLRVVELKVPPLRDRRDDILPLARVLLANASTRLGRHACGLTPQAAQLLLRYDWPGNVRELENAMERALALATGTQIDADDLPDELKVAAATARPFTPGDARPLADIERDYILAVLKQNGGNKKRTAQQLQLGTATLFRKLKQYSQEGVRLDA